MKIVKTITNKLIKLIQRVIPKSKRIPKTTMVWMFPEYPMCRYSINYEPYTSNPIIELEFVTPFDCGCMDG